MDPIEQLIRSVNPDPERSGADLDPRVLRAMRHSEFQLSESDDPAKSDGRLTAESGRPGWVPKLIGVAAAAAVIGGVAFVASQFPQDVPPPAVTPTQSQSTQSESPNASAAPEPNDLPEPDGAPTPNVLPTPGDTETVADWQTYTTPSGLMTFELPPNWSVQKADFYPAEEMLAVYNSDGELMATLANGLPPTGFACGPEQWEYGILDFEPMSLPSDPLNRRSIDPVYSYRVLKSDPMVISYGITGSTGGDRNCTLINSVYSTGEAGIYMFANHVMVRPAVEGISMPGYRELRVGSVAEAEAYQQSDEYARIRRMITSLQVSQ